MGAVKKALMAETMDDMTFIENVLGFKLNPTQAAVYEAVKDKKITSLPVRSRSKSYVSK